VISGRQPSTGTPFVNQIILGGVTCGGASPSADGWLLLAGVGDSGMLWRDSVELDELRFPMLVHEQRLLPDTEGAGRTRGAPAAYVEYGPRGADLEVMYASDGSVNAPQGVLGGEAGKPARAYRRGPDGSLVELPNCDRVVLRPGETIVSVSCSGGGYGAARERDPAAVASDVREGYVSAERAREVYGWSG
jgi:N-methylhydantoinase B